MKLAALHESLSVPERTFLLKLQSALVDNDLGAYKIGPFKLPLDRALAQGTRPLKTFVKSHDRSISIGIFADIDVRVYLQIDTTIVDLFGELGDSESEAKLIRNIIRLVKNTTPVKFNQPGSPHGT